MVAGVDDVAVETSVVARRGAVVAAVGGEQAGVDAWTSVAGVTGSCRGMRVVVTGARRRVAGAVVVVGAGVTDVVTAASGTSRLGARG